MKKQNSKPFACADPFNPQNNVEGIIYVDEKRYGDLWIQKVNGEICEQYIHVTPKFLYPGDVESPRYVKRGCFPKFKKIRIYDKLDGTNICMFRYHDSNHNLFTSYKTRLVPFLKKSAMGDWITMWNKMMSLYPSELKKLIDNTEYNFGFEMYGSYNQVLIKYDVTLDNRLLYAIKRDDGMIIDPFGFPYPKPSMLLEFDSTQNPDDIYEEFRRNLEEKFKQGTQVEGCVMYIHCTDDTMKVWKCKPDSVLELQVESSQKFVSYSNAYTTAINAAENIEEFSFEHLLRETIDLLKEEYEDFFIELSMDQIKKAVANASDYITLKNSAIESYKSIGIQWKNEKSQIGTIMREIMKAFPKNRSADVFNIIKGYASIFEK